MRVRTISLGLGVAAALVLSSMTIGTATAASPDGPAASLATGSSGSTDGATVKSAFAKPKCGTGFGAELPTPDGLIAWNDGGSYDTAGAADVVCKGKAKKRTIKKVAALGYFGTATETFNVTFYGDSTAGGSSEPDDSNVLCDYQGLTGTAGGQYPTNQLTELQLTSKCKLPKGVSWVSIQNQNSAGPWYWEMTNDMGGQAPADWVDRNNAFGTGCTTFDNDRYLVDCLGYDYADYMLEIR